MKPSEFEYPYRFPKCFHNNNLEEALKAITFSFQNRRHVILTGSEGNGITQVARWVSQFYNKTVKNKSNFKLIIKSEIVIVIEFLTKVIYSLRINQIMKISLINIFVFY